MAKGQMKSNKEVRKPKKDKVAAKAPAAFDSAVKQAEASKPAGKPKG